MNNGCCHRPTRTWSFTPAAAIGFLLFVLAFAVGVIVGIWNANMLFPVLAAIVAFVAAIAVIVIALILFNWRKKRDC